MTLSVDRICPTAGTGINRAPLDTAHIYIVADTQSKTGGSRKHIVYMSRQPSKLFSRIDRIGIGLFIVSRLRRCDFLRVPPFFALNPFVLETFLNIYIYRSAHSQQISQNRSEIIPLYGYIGCKIFCNDRGCSFQHLQTEMYGTLLVAGNEIVDYQRTVIRSNIISPFIKFITCFILHNRCGINLRTFGIGTTDSLAGNGI